MAPAGDTVSDAVVSLARGGLAIIVGDEDHPGEAHLICTAAGVSTGTIAYFLEHGSGLVQVPLTAIRARWLLLEPMAADGEHVPGRAGVDVMQTVDYVTGTSTGISAADRAATAAALADPRIRPADLARPGHIIPVRADPGGVLAYPGRTEAAITLCVLAGSVPVAVMTELVSADRLTMLDGTAAAEFGRKHGIPVVSVPAVRTRVQRSSQRVQRSGEADIPTEMGTFHAIAYRDRDSGVEHLALTRGDLAAGHPVLVRLHAECVAGDALKSRTCRCEVRMDAALQQLAEAPRAVFVYLRGNYGRGLGAGGPHARDAHASEPALPGRAELGTDDLAAQILLDLGVRVVNVLTTTDAAGAIGEHAPAAGGATGLDPEAFNVVGYQTLRLPERVARQDGRPSSSPS